MNINNLFVYGTLRKGEKRSHHLKNFEFLTTFKIPGKLYNTDLGYPVAVYNSKNTTFIHGELYSIPNECLDIIDNVEELDENFYVRSQIKYNNQIFFLYEPGDKLKKFVKKKYLIENGNWYTENGLAKKNPSSFAENFEFFHKDYYSKKPNERSNSVIFLEGKIPVLITCAHSTVHKRLNKLKSHELYTAAIGTILHSKLNCYCLYSNRILSSDPNYYDSSYFKTTLDYILRKFNFEFILDIHGTGEYRKFDLYPGIGNKNEFLLGKNEILDLLYRKSKKFKFIVGGLDIFPAVKQKTITKFCATKFQIPSMQLEIKKDLRIPRNNPKFLNLINFLSEFLKEILI